MRLSVYSIIMSAVAWHFPIGKHMHMVGVHTCMNVRADCNLSSTAANALTTLGLPKTSFVHNERAGLR